MTMSPHRAKSSTAHDESSRVLPLEGVGASRNDFVKDTRAYLKLLTRPIIETRTPKTGGREFVGNFSRMVDTITGLLFQRAAQDNGVSPDKSGIAVIAMGGYGRAELAPYSDVDILVVCRRKSPMVDAVAGDFIRYMWDVGFDLGHAVESLVESESALSRHMDTKTAVIESRWVCGSKRVAKAIERQVSRIRREERQEYLRRKIQDALVRYAKYGNSFQLIEPNVKNSPGGMRDFQTLVWLGQVNKGSRGLGALRQKGLLLSGEQRELEAAYDFLLRVRVELHLATRSKQDQLTVAMQRKLARALGYKPRGGHLDVEFFMREYYHHTRAIYRITSDILKELHHGEDVGVLLGRRRAKQAGTLNVRLIRKKMREEPLYIFQRQKDTGLPLDRALRRRLELVLREDLKGQQATRRMRAAFAAMFEESHNLGLVLRSLHEMKFLGRIIPEYNRLTCLKRYDLYHHYTVDEHSFRVLENVVALDGADSDPDDPLVRLYHEIDDKRPLFLAALLHDVGKIGGHGHAKKGATLARKILGRMPIPPEEIELVSFLIRHHLLMSQFSQRRDPADIGTLTAFCKKVESSTNLKYLCLLTYADYKATSPVVWNQWKQSLLWALYLRAYDFIKKKEKAPEVVYKAHKQRLLEAFAAGPVRNRVLTHLDLLPGGYLLTMDPIQVKQHMEMVEELERRSAVVSHSERDGLHEFTFCTHDQPYRLSQLCGVLAVNDFNIFHAYAFTRADGTVIDVFLVEDLTAENGGAAAEDRPPRTDPAFARRIESIQRDIESVIAGDLDLDAATARHAKRWRRARQPGIPAPANVKFENDLSGDFTIIDVFAPDAPGLLFRITRALSREGLTISRARISTEADRAIDSFYVGDESGNKIKSASRLKRIRTTLEEEIAPGE
jgi:[protein-PII] uridylyltransferase